METLWQDIRFTLRTLARNLGFACIAVFTLAVGVGATATVATVAGAVLLHSLPYPDPQHLLVLQGYKNEKGTLETFLTSYLDYRDWRTRLTSFSDLGAYNGPKSMNLLSAGEPERVNAEIADSDYFRLLGVHPALGRTLTRQDDANPGAARVAVLSHAMWQRRFGSDRAAVGKSLVLDGESYEVVGVMQAGFKGLSDATDVWLPLSLTKELMGSRFYERRGARWLNVIGRPRPGVTMAAAQHELDASNAALARDFPTTNEDMVAKLKTLDQSLFGDLRFPLLTLLGASLFVLLIAWATVANLLLARATARRREIAVRGAVGATRLRLVRQLLTESIVLAGGSCVVGLLIARSATAPLVAISGVQFPTFVDLGLNLPMVLSIAALSLLCGTVFGLTPAWLGVRGSITTLREGSSSLGVVGQRFQSSLVVAEVALALLLLTGAGLMVRGFQHFSQADLGFAPKDLLEVRVELKGKRYADKKIMILKAREYRDRLQAIPGVRSASLVAPFGPGDPFLGSTFVVEDLLRKTKDGAVFLVFHHVSPGFFENLRMPLLAGRGFAESDSDASLPVIVISQAMKRKVWPNESPLGKRMRFGRTDPGWFTVVGVVGDLNEQAMQQLEWPGPDVYFDAFQFPSAIMPVHNFLVRAAAGRALALAPAVEREIRAVSPDLPPYDVETMEERLADFTAKGRFLVVLMTLFAALALVIAAVGLYGVLFYSVTQRTRELGIRVALGAQARDVANLVVGQAALLTAIGLVIGLAGALSLSRLFASLFYGVSATDLATFAETSLVLMGVAMAAAWFPVRRAVRIPPTVALRAE
jgi:putative ABC transport system permease protein